MKKDKFICISFVVILLVVLLSYPVTFLLVRSGKKSVVMTDNWQFFTPVKENNIVDKINNSINSKKVSIENRITNYFPFYVSLNELYENSNYLTNSMIYKDNVPIKANSDGDLLFYNKKDNFYYLESPYSKKDLDKKLNSQIEFYNKLANEGIDLSIYIPTNYELTTLKEDNLNEYIDRFEKGLNDNIKVSHMNVTSIDDYKDKFYATDHHWTINGAIDGYDSIMDMLGADKINNFNYKNYEQVKFYGSMAKTAMLKNNYDYLKDIDIKLNYDVKINGGSVTKTFKPRDLKIKNNNDYYDYYVQYFDGQYAEVMYDYHNDNKDNLLILADSYAWQIDYLIASSFNKTYVVNLRYGKYQTEKLDIKKYIEDNDIDKVLVLCEGELVLFDNDNYNMEDKVI